MKLKMILLAAVIASTPAFCEESLTAQETAVFFKIDKTSLRALSNADIGTVLAAATNLALLVPSKSNADALSEIREEALGRALQRAKSVQ